MRTHLIAVAPAGVVIDARIPGVVKAVQSVNGEKVAQFVSIHLDRPVWVVMSALEVQEHDL